MEKKQVKIKRQMPAGELLRDIILMKSWSIYRIAKKLDSSSNQVTRWLSGEDLYWSNYMKIVDLWNEEVGR